MLLQLVTSMSRQEPPLQPLQERPNLFLASLQRPGAVMSLQRAPLSRQDTPLQPMHDIPQTCFDTKQAVSSVMSAQVADLVRQADPPQPRQSTPYNFLLCAHKTGELISEHCVTLSASLTSKSPRPIGKESFTTDLKTPESALLTAAGLMSGSAFSPAAPSACSRCERATMKCCTSTSSSRSVRSAPKAQAAVAEMTKPTRHTISECRV
mmetsp:Transcript_21221/g.49389  ORF Transcript_21221/g.49389 Transcript_21221/m.49389 type:complete len:209 (+) Transcript_21221:1432-2058(+)